MKRITRTYTLRVPTPHALPRNPSNQPLWIGRGVKISLAVLGVVLVAFVGCSTTSKARTGLRAEFEGIRVQRIAVLPFEVTSAIDAQSQERADLIGMYEGAAISQLTRLYPTVHAPTYVRTHLPDGVGLRDMRDAFELRDHLSNAFEEEDRSTERVRQRSAFVKTLGEHLGVDAFFLGQVVYHTDAMCEASEESLYTEYVFVEGGATPEGSRVPCAVSHFQAKLVDAKTGRVVWFNRALREVRAASVERPTPSLQSNARNAVQLVVSDSEDSLTQSFLR